MSTPELMTESHDGLLGQVTLNDIPTKAKLYRFCQKKIDQWLRAQQLEMKTPETAFRVSFSEDDGEQISCVTEIQCGPTIWRGCDLAHDSQQAFMHSLKRLQPH